MVEIQLDNWRLSKWNPIGVRIQGLISKSTDYSTQAEELSTVTLDHVKNVEQLIGN